MVFMSPLIGALLGFMVGTLVSSRWRRPALIAALLVPVGVYTFDLTAGPPTEQGFFAWWVTGLLMLGPLFFLAALLTATAYYGGVTLRRAVLPD